MTDHEKELEEQLKWYRENWEKIVERDITNTKQFLDITEQIQKVVEESNQRIQELVDENNQFSAANAHMIGILQVYAKYDPLIISYIRNSGKNYPLSEGPATIYLRQIGALESEPKGRN